MGTDFTLTKTAVKKCGANSVSVGRARLMIPFGTHHSKISIFESSAGRVHIIIGTANLLENDWNFKTQAFYHCSGIEVSKMLMLYVCTQFQNCHILFSFQRRSKNR